MRREIRELRNGGLAQLVEHLLCTQGVKGSSPSSSKKYRQHKLPVFFFRGRELSPDYFVC